MVIPALNFNITNNQPLKDCSICLNPCDGQWNNPIVAHNVSGHLHPFHRQCVKNKFIKVKSECPCCRNRIDFKSLSSCVTWQEKILSSVKYGIAPGILSAIVDLPREKTILKAAAAVLKGTCLGTAWGVFYRAVTEERTPVLWTEVRNRIAKSTTKVAMGAIAVGVTVGLTISPFLGVSSGIFLGSYGGLLAGANNPGGLETIRQIEKIAGKESFIPVLVSLSVGACFDGGLGLKSALIGSVVGYSMEVLKPYFL